MKSFGIVDFVNFKFKKGIEVILGGIEQKNSNNFLGILYDWNFATFYMENPLEFGYMMGSQTNIYENNGIWFGTQFSFIDGKLQIFGKEENVDISINEKLKERLELQTDKLNSKEYINQNIYGINLFRGETITLSSVKLFTLNNSIKEILTSQNISFGIRKFIMYLNFSYKEIIGDEMKLITSSKFPSMNTFSISLVEKAKENSYKKFLENGVNVILASENISSSYNYDSSRNSPKVLKLDIRTNNGKIFTFLSPIQILPNKQYKLMIGFFVYKPDVIRAYFEYKNQFIFSHEESDLGFDFSNTNVYSLII